MNGQRARALFRKPDAAVATMLRRPRSARTPMNAVEIEQAISDLALQPFDAAEFPFAFLAAFGNKDTALKRLRTGNNNASDVPGGVLQRNIRSASGRCRWRSRNSRRCPLFRHR